VTPALRAQVLREWRPLDGAVEPLHQKSAAPMSKLIPGVMKGLGLEQRLQQSQVFFLWPNLVGADIARHAQPVSLRNGLLIIAVDHPIWLQELSRFHKTLILQKVQAKVGKKAVRDIVLRIG
jgi:predicted nucleic acid-binding Zn ribbon protein